MSSRAEQKKKGQNKMSQSEMEKRIEAHNMRLAWGDTSDADRTYRAEEARQARARVRREQAWEAQQAREEAWRAQQEAEEAEYYRRREEHQRIESGYRREEARLRLEEDRLRRDAETQWLRNHS